MLLLYQSQRPVYLFANHELTQGFEATAGRERSKPEWQCVRYGDALFSANLSVTGSQPGQQLLGREALRVAYQALLDDFPSIFEQNSNHPKLVIAIDDAHTLAEATRSMYRPIDVLCRAIKTCLPAECSNWVLFVSTATLFPSGTFIPWVNRRHPAYCLILILDHQFGDVVHTPLSLPPYIHLDWDQMAQSLPKILPAEAAQFRNIAGLGRPL